MPAYGPATSNTDLTQRHSVFSNLNSRQDSPLYKSHPIYPLRRFLIINAIIGFFLTLLACVYAPRYLVWVWGWGLFAMVLSGFISILDLFLWVCHKREAEIEKKRSRSLNTLPVGQVCGHCHDSTAQSHEEHNNATVLAVSGATTEQQSSRNDSGPHFWPVKCLMIIEFLLTLMFIWLWFCELVCIVDPFNYSFVGYSFVVRAYATVPTLFAIVLHAKCWWRQFREREKQRWRDELDLEVGAGETHLDAGSSVQAGGGQNRNQRSTDMTPSYSALPNSIKSIVGQLNREASKVLSSEAWLGHADSSMNQERRALLARQAAPHIKEPSQEGVTGCTCAHGGDYGMARVLSSKSANSKPTRAEIPTRSDCISPDVDGVEPISIEPCTPCLTPSNSQGSTTDSDDTGATNAEGKAIDFEDVAKNRPGVDDDDATIMVVKKVKNAKKSRYRKVEINEEEED